MALYSDDLVPESALLVGPQLKLKLKLDGSIEFRDQSKHHTFNFKFGE